ncbi:MAG: hypothetical protein AUH37_01540 [Candidatus Nitrososphaera sp. 13_1_40CM_48_12]|nr:MAG: hypothetical protein AUH37_01540 [Candidatus Nitrososphaera sp. 13_1_40CM_48_12]
MLLHVLQNDFRDIVAALKSVKPADGERGTELQMKVVFSYLVNLSCPRLIECTILWYFVNLYPCFFKDEMRISYSFTVLTNFRLQLKWKIPPLALTTMLLDLP